MEEKIIGKQIQAFNISFRKAVKYECDKEGIPSSYFFILLFIGKQKNKNVTQSDIIDFVKFKPSTISVTLQTMEKDKLIKKTKDKDDNRKTILSLTPKGKTYCSKICSILNKIESSMHKVVSKEELDKFFDITDKLNECLRKRVVQ